MGPCWYLLLSCATTRDHARFPISPVCFDVQAGVLPVALPSLQFHSKEPFGLTSFALSLLLVFRTNAR